MDAIRRLILFHRRARCLFESTFAQRPDALTLGTEIRLRFVNGQSQLSFGVLPPEESIAHALVLLRPMTLASDQLSHVKLRQALRQLADPTDEALQSHLDNLDRDWSDYRAPRWQVMAGNASTGESLLDPIDDSDIARKWLYSDLVHGDDEAAILDLLDAPYKQFAAYAMVRDGLLLVANIWWLRHQVAPHVIPQVADLGGKLRVTDA